MIKATHHAKVTFSRHMSLEVLTTSHRVNALIGMLMRKLNMRQMLNIDRSCATGYINRDYITI